MSSSATYWPPILCRKSEKSVIRYEQRARLAQTYQRLPASLQAHLDRCEQHLGDVLLGRMAADAQFLAGR